MSFLALLLRLINRSVDFCKKKTEEVKGTLVLAHSHNTSTSARQSGTQKEESGLIWEENQTASPPPILFSNRI
jgi:hypothetical protein